MTVDEENALRVAANKANDPTAMAFRSLFAMLDVERKRAADLRFVAEQVYFRQRGARAALKTILENLDGK